MNHVGMRVGGLETQSYLNIYIYIYVCMYLKERAIINTHKIDLALVNCLWKAATTTTTTKKH